VWHRMQDERTDRTGAPGEQAMWMRPPASSRRRNRYWLAVWAGQDSRIPPLLENHSDVGPSPVRGTEESGGLASLFLRISHDRRGVKPEESLRPQGDRLFYFPLLDAGRPVGLHGHLQTEGPGRDRRKRNGVVLVFVYSPRPGASDGPPRATVFVQHAP